MTCLLEIILNPLFFIIKMVVLTMIADSNDHKARFREPLDKSDYIRLLTCSLHNSWYNLREKGEISILDRQDNASVETIPSMHS